MIKYYQFLVCDQKRLGVSTRNVSSSSDENSQHKIYSSLWSVFHPQNNFSNPQSACFSSHQPVELDVLVMDLSHMEFKAGLKVTAVDGPTADWNPVFSVTIMLKRSSLRRCFSRSHTMVSAGVRVEKNSCIDGNTKPSTWQEYQLMDWFTRHTDGYILHPFFVQILSLVLFTCSPPLCVWISCHLYLVRQVGRQKERD